MLAAEPPPNVAMPHALSHPLALKTEKLLISGKEAKIRRYARDFGSGLPLPTPSWRALGTRLRSRRLSASSSNLAVPTIASHLVSSARLPTKPSFTFWIAVRGPGANPGRPFSHPLEERFVVP